MSPQGVELFVGLDPIDLRWGFERLGGAIAERLGRDVRSGALFVFYGRRRTALKVMSFDGSGLGVFYKRLDRGAFRIPTAPEGATTVTIDEHALDALLDGIVVDAVSRRRRPLAH